MPRKIIALALSLCFICQQTGFGQFVAAPIVLNSGHFRPLHLRYLAVNPSGGFELLLDRGDSANLSEEQIDTTTAMLMRYFHIGLRLPDASFWVNLRPDGQDEIIDPLLEKTDIGKVMLEADLQLKKDLARMTDPGTPEGRQYWDKLYGKAEQLFGPQEDMEIPTLARPWIVPGEIIIGIHERGAYVYKATLSVMLEQDHLKDSSLYAFSDPRLKQLNEYAAQLLRASILPRLCREVNSAKRYAPLRQVYYSLILAQWYKQRFQSPIVNSKDLTGLTSTSPWSKTTYFEAYRQSFQQGEYNKTESVGSGNGLVVRQYASGGLLMTTMNMLKEEDGRFNPALFGKLADLVFRIVPQEDEQGDKLSRIKQIIETGGERALWSAFLDWEQSIALFLATPDGFQVIADKSSELFDKKFIGNTAEKLLNSENLAYHAQPLMIREDSSSTGSRSGKPITVPAVFVKVTVGSQQYVAVMSTSDTERDDLVQEEVNEFRKTKLPAATLVQRIIRVVGLPGSGKTEIINEMRSTFGDALVNLHLTDWADKRGGEDIGRLVAWAQSAGRLVHISIDDFIEEYFKKHYEHAVKVVDMGALPEGWKDELQKWDEKGKRILDPASREVNCVLYSDFLVNALHRLRNKYPQAQLQEWISGKLSIRPVIAENAADQRIWEEIDRRLCFRWNESSAEKRREALFNKDELWALDAQARVLFREVEEALIAGGINLIIESSGLNPEENKIFDRLGKEHEFAVHTVAMYIGKQQAIDHVLSRKKWLDEVLFAGALHTTMDEYYQVGEDYYREASSNRDAELNQLYGVFGIAGSDGGKQIQGIDASSVRKERNSAPGFAERVERLKKSAYPPRAFKADDLGGIFEGMLPEEMKAGLHAQGFERTISDLQVIASDSSVYPSMRAEALSALSTAYYAALQENFSPELEKKLYGILISLSGAQNGILAMQSTTGGIRQTLAQMPDQRLGYVLIMSLARNPEQLLEIVNDPQIGIRHRLYAALVYSDVTADLSIFRKTFSVGAGQQKTLTEISAAMIRQMSAPERSDDYSLFENTYMQDEELKVYCLAVLLQAADAFPVLFNEALMKEYILGISISARAATYASEANAALFIGGDRDFLASFDFWGIIAHELGHHLVPDLAVSGTDELAVTELMCELLAVVVSDHVGFRLQRLSRFWQQEYEKGLIFIGDDYHRLARGQAHLLSSYDQAYGDSFSFDARALFLSGYQRMESAGRGHLLFSDFVQDMIEQSFLHRGEFDGVHSVSYTPTNTWVFPGEGGIGLKDAIMVRFRELDSWGARAMRRWQDKGDSKKLWQGSSEQVVPEEHSAKPGGIDLRSLRANASFGALTLKIADPRVWQEAAAAGDNRSLQDLSRCVQAALAVKAMPDETLLRQYVLTLCREDTIDSVETVRADIARILRLEEEQGVQSASLVQESLTIITAVSPSEVLRNLLVPGHG